MEIKEAVGILKGLQEPEAWEPQITEKTFEALDMAIMALEKSMTITENTLFEMGIIERGEMPGTFSQDNEKDIPPHGRLIDADAMYDRLIRLKDKSIQAGDWLESFAIGFTLGFMSKEETVIEATTRKVENGNSEDRIKER